MTLEEYQSLSQEEITLIAEENNINIISIDEDGLITLSIDLIEDVILIKEMQGDIEFYNTPKASRIIGNVIYKLLDLSVFNYIDGDLILNDSEITDLSSLTGTVTGNVYCYRCSKLMNVQNNNTIRHGYLAPFNFNSDYGQYLVCNGETNLYNKDHILPYLIITNGILKYPISNMGLKDFIQIEDNWSWRYTGGVKQLFVSFKLLIQPMYLMDKLVLRVYLKQNNNIIEALTLESIKSNIEESPIAINTIIDINPNDIISIEFLNLSTIEYTYIRNISLNITKIQN